LKLFDADTTENATDTKNPVVTAVSCPLPNRAPDGPKMSGSDPVRILAGSRLRSIMGADSSDGEYFCNYELNKEYEARLETAGLRISARGNAGEVRAVELPEHRFFVATLFQPQRASTAEKPHPVVIAFLGACVEFRRFREAS
jgi:CTP synthase (UTP-ammonia lyase)